MVSLSNAHNARQELLKVRLATLSRIISRETARGSQASISDLARMAEVSRSFLYQNEEAAELVARYSRQLRRQVGSRQRCHVESHADLLTRAKNSESEVARLRREIVALRKTLAEQFHHVRELDMGLPPGGVKALHELLIEKSGELEMMQERAESNERQLEAVRDLMRFREKRISQLEVEILDLRSGNEEHDR